MSFNGSGTFQINSSGQPVITGTVISSTAFNALTADLATGLSTCVTKDGQTATTVRVPFAFGISSTLTTDATSATTGSIITAGGISMQKALWVGTTSRHVGAATFDSTIASGAITSSGIVSGSQLRLDNATFTRVATPDGGGGFAGGYNVTYSSGVKHDSTGSAAGFYYSSSTGVTLYAAASQSAGTALTPVATFAQGGAATFASTIASGAITSTGAVTGTLFTPTATGNNGLGLAAAGTPAIYVNGTTEAARFTTTGGLLVGTTGVPNGTSIYGSALVPVSFDRTRLCMAASSTSSLELVQFFNPNGQVGAISTSGSATAYTTSSDYRLKENVQPMTGGLATVAALKPVTYDWIRTGFAGEGFIAHELQAVIPAAVSGEKDAVDDKGEINPQGVDFGKIVPHLVAAIQELTTRLAALENKS